MKKLTKEQKEKYLKSKGIRCPFCNSAAINAGKIEVNINEAHSKVKCLLCNSVWIDVWELTGIVHFQSGQLPKPL